MPKTIPMVYVISHDTHRHNLDYYFWQYVVLFLISECKVTTVNAHSKTFLSFFLKNKHILDRYQRFKLPFVENRKKFIISQLNTSQNRTDKIQQRFAQNSYFVHDFLSNSVLRTINKIRNKKYPHIYSKIILSDLSQYDNYHERK